MKKSNKFSPEVRERAVRMVQEHRGEYPSLWAAVELRLGEKRTGQLEDLVGLAQFLVLAFEFLQALQLGRGDAVLRPRIDLMALDPLMQRLGHAADFGCDRFDGRPL